MDKDEFIWDTFLDFVEKKEWLDTKSLNISDEFGLVDFLEKQKAT